MCHEMYEDTDFQPCFGVLSRRPDNYLGGEQKPISPKSPNYSSNLPLLRTSRCRVPFSVAFSRSRVSCPKTRSFCPTSNPLPTSENKQRPFYHRFHFWVNKKLWRFLPLHKLRPAFCFSFSQIRLHILYAIVSGDATIRLIGGIHRRVIVNL